MYLLAYVWLNHYFSMAFLWLFYKPLKLGHHPTHPAIGQPAPRQLLQTDADQGRLGVASIVQAVAEASLTAVIVAVCGCTV